MYEWQTGRPRSDATFCGIRSGSTLFAQACLSIYIGYVRYSFSQTAKKKKKITGKLPNHCILIKDVCKLISLPGFLLPAEIQKTTPVSNLIHVSKNRLQNAKAASDISDFVSIAFNSSCPSFSSPINFALRNN